MKTALFNPIFINPLAYFVFPQLYDIIPEYEVLVEQCVFTGTLMVQTSDNTSVKFYKDTKSIDLSEFANSIITISLYTDIGATVLGLWVLYGTNEPDVPAEWELNIIARYSTKGKTNSDSNKDILEDLSGNGYDLTLEGFVFDSTNGYENIGGGRLHLSPGCSLINSSFLLPEHYTVIYKRIIDRPDVTKEGVFCYAGDELSAFYGNGFIINEGDTGSNKSYVSTLYGSSGTNNRVLVYPGNSIEYLLPNNYIGLILYENGSYKPAEDKGLTFGKRTDVKLLEFDIYLYDFIILDKELSIDEIQLVVHKYIDKNASVYKQVPLSIWNLIDEGSVYNVIASRKMTITQTSYNIGVLRCSFYSLNHYINNTWKLKVQCDVPVVLLISLSNSDEEARLQLNLVNGINVIPPFTGISSDEMQYMQGVTFKLDIPTDDNTTHNLEIEEVVDEKGVTGKWFAPKYPTINLKEWTSDYTITATTGSLSGSISSATDTTVIATSATYNSLGVFTGVMKINATCPIYLEYTDAYENKGKVVLVNGLDDFINVPLRGQVVNKLVANNLGKDFTFEIEEYLGDEGSTYFCTYEPESDKEWLLSFIYADTYESTVIDLGIHQVIVSRTGTETDLNCILFNYYYDNNAVIQVVSEAGNPLKLVGLDDWDDVVYTIDIEQNKDIVINRLDNIEAVLFIIQCVNNSPDTITLKEIPQPII